VRAIQRTYKSTFEAGHFIRGHPKCGVQHGHSYNLIVHVNGFAEKWLDFADIKTTVDSFVQKKFDHQFLGDISAEKISEQISEYLETNGWSGKLELMETSKFGITLPFGKEVSPYENDKEESFVSHQ